MALSDWLAALTQPGTTKLGQPRSIQKLKDPYYRFQSVEEVQIAASLGVRIDVNQASVDDWLRLPGLSIHQARVLAELTQSGVHFHCIEDIAAAINQPIQRLKPLEPILLFCYYDPASVQTIQCINVNTAKVEEMLRVPGMDLYLARKIVQNRAQGPYRNLVHLQRRLGLSADLTAQLLHYLKF